jgi:hypothetical protein
MTEYAPLIALIVFGIGICGIAIEIFTHKWPSDKSN